MAYVGLTKQSREWIIYDLSLGLARKGHLFMAFSTTIHIFK